MFRVAVEKANMQKADSSWTEGVFLGVDDRSTQFLVGTKEYIQDSAPENQESGQRARVPGEVLG